MFTHTENKMTDEKINEIHINEIVDVSSYPLKDKCVCDKNSHFTIKNIYGDAIRFLYFLVRHDILDISDHAYREIVKICKTPVKSLKKENINRFKEILNDGRVNNSSLIRLMGDELKGKAKTQYFVIEIIKFLLIKKFSLEIILSDTSLELIKYTELEIAFTRLLNTSKDKSSHKNKLTKDYPNLELQALQDYVDYDLITTEELSTLINKYYKPYLKIMDYMIDENSHHVTIYSYSKIAHSDIREISETLLTYNEDNEHDHIQLINDSNEKFMMHVCADFSFQGLFSFRKVFDNILSRPEIDQGVEKNIKYFYYDLIGENNLSTQEKNLSPREILYDVHYAHGVKSLPNQNTVLAPKKRELQRRKTESFKKNTVPVDNKISLSIEFKLIKFCKIIYSSKQINENIIDDFLYQVLINKDLINLLNILDSNKLLSLENLKLIISKVNDFESKNYKRLYEGIAFLAEKKFLSSEKFIELINDPILAIKFKKLLSIIDKNPKIFIPDNIDELMSLFMKIKIISNSISFLSEKKHLTMDAFYAVLTLTKANMLNYKNLDILIKADNRPIGGALKLIHMIGISITRPIFNVVVNNDEFMSSLLAYLKNDNIKDNKERLKIEIEKQLAVFTKKLPEAHQMTERNFSLLFNHPTQKIKNETVVKLSHQSNSI